MRVIATGEVLAQRSRGARFFGHPHLLSADISGLAHVFACDYYWRLLVI